MRKLADESEAQKNLFTFLAFNAKTPRSGRNGLAITNALAVQAINFLARNKSDNLYKPHTTAPGKHTNLLPRKAVYR